MRFGHVNLVARDWQVLADFYCSYLGCTRLEPIRDLHGPLIDAGVGCADARIRGVHVRLPGFGDNGPTLEIYRYDPLIDVPANVRRSGFGHLAFQVDDIEATRQALVHGGGTVSARSYPRAQVIVVSRGVMWLIPRAMPSSSNVGTQIDSC